MPDTWVCEVCKQDRPDSQISVLKIVKVVDDTRMTINVKFCNDDMNCRNGAINTKLAKSFTEGTIRNG